MMKNQNDMEDIDLKEKDDREPPPEQGIDPRGDAFSEASRQWDQVATVEMVISPHETRSSRLYRQMAIPDETIMVESESESTVATSLASHNSFLSPERIRILKLAEIEDYFQRCDLSDYLVRIQTLTYMQS